MKLLLSLFLSLACCIAGFSQNGVYLYGAMENAPSSPVQIDIAFYDDSSMTQGVLHTQPSGTINTQWFDLPVNFEIQYIIAGFYDCVNNYSVQNWSASEFDNLIDIPLYFNYCTDTIVLGCTDPQALNYNPQANYDDGSCEFANCELNEITVLLNTQAWGAEISWSLINDSIAVASGGNYASNNSYSSTWCVPDGCYTLEMSDMYGDGWNGASFEITWNGETIQSGTLANGNYGENYFGINQEGCPETPPVYGCTDSLAINYNPFATIDDGSCDYTIQAENDLCADAISLTPGQTITINNSNAHENEGIWGECWGFGQGEGEQSSLWYSFTTPDYPAAIHIETIIDGTNTLTDTQFGLYDSCGGAMIYCDGNSGAGLMSAFDFECGELTENSTYILLIDGWNGDSGSCLLQFEIDSTCTTVVPGCTDPDALNYNPLATQSDGSCIYENPCTEVMIQLDGPGFYNGNWVISSENFISSGPYTGSDYAINDCLVDGCYTISMESSDTISDVYYSVFIDNQMVNIGVINNWQSGTFSIGSGCDTTSVIYGCTDSLAVNFNPNATVDDGSCEYEIACDFNQIEVVISTLSWGDEISWNLLDADSNSIAIGNGYGSYGEYTSQWCLDNGCYTFLMSDDYGDGWHGGGFEVISSNGEILASGTIDNGYSGSVNFGINQDGCTETAPVYGCTDPEAVNYNPDATEDDGSCQYQNCTEVLIMLDNNGDSAFWSLTSSNGYDTTGYYPGWDFDIVDCLEDGCYTFELDSNIADVYFNVFVDNQIIAQEVLGANGIAEFQIGSICDTDTSIYGCTDSSAVNYNPEATHDDGSCIYQFECSIDFIVVPDSLGEDVIWILPTDNILTATEVFWDFGDGTTSTDLFPSHEYIGDGPFTLCLTATFASPDSSTCTITYCATLTGDMVGGAGFTSSEGGFTINVINNASTVGITTPEAVSDLTLWPNPATGQLNIRFNLLNSNSVHTMEILDVTGKTVIQKLLNITAGEVTQLIDVTSLKSGVYLFKLTSTDQIETRRFVIAR